MQVEDKSIEQELELNFKLRDALSGYSLDAVIGALDNHLRFALSQVEEPATMHSLATIDPEKGFVPGKLKWDRTAQRYAGMPLSVE
jgi:hypothetical protein